MTEAESAIAREVSSVLPWPLRALWYIFRFFLWVAVIVWVLATVGLNYAVKGELEETMTKSFGQKSTVTAMRMGWNLTRPTVAAMGITVGADLAEPLAKVGNFEVGLYLWDPAPGPDGSKPMYYLGIGDLRIGSKDYGSYQAKIREPKPKHTFVQELKGKIGKGTVSGTASDDNKGNWEADLTGEKIDYSYFAKGVTGGEARVTLKMKGNRRGRDRVRTLQGRVTLAGGEGKLEGNDLNLWAGNLLTSFLPGQSKDTHLNCAIADFDVKNGIAQSKTIIIDTDKATITGRGTVDLVNQRLNMRFTPHTKGLASISIATPVVVSGPFDNITTRPDARGVAEKFGGMLLGVVAPPAALLPFLNAGKDSSPCAKYLTRKEAP